MSPSGERPAPDSFTFDAAVVLMFLLSSGLIVMLAVVLCGGDVVVTGVGEWPSSWAKEAVHDARNRRKSLKDVMVARFEARDVTSTHKKFGFATQ